MISSLSGGAHRLFSIVLPSFALSLGACSIPRDPSGTMDRVEQSGTLRLGVIEGAEMNEASRRTLARVLDRTGSRPETQRGEDRHELDPFAVHRLDESFVHAHGNSPGHSKCLAYADWP